MLSVDPLLFLFLEHYGLDVEFPDVFPCLQKLYRIIELLKAGPAGALRFLDQLRTLIESHHREFQRQCRAMTPDLPA